MNNNCHQVTVPHEVPAMRQIRRIHFVGIGGSGMCGIAEVLKNLGYDVTGSDQAESANTKHLVEEGVQVLYGHAASHAQGADVVVTSTAVAEDNPEVEWARQSRVPIVPRAQMLGEIMRYRHGIAVGGTHGKTTTTSIIATLLAEGGYDPTFVIGGLLKGAKRNARLGAGRFFVAEADESDASFLHLQPQVVVVTNIDADHMETYDGDFERLKSTFLNFIHNLPFYGLAVLCADDEHVQSLLPQINRAYVTYGFGADRDYRAAAVEQSGVSMRFTVTRPQPHATLSVQLPSAGRHNVLNALAAIAVATEEGVADQEIIDGLAHFSGVGRRFEVYPNCHAPAGEFLLVDDYGHHPRELAVVIEAARAAYPQRRIVMVFQPHRYTRTRDLYEDFVDVLSRVDVLLLLDIYSAGESPIQGVTAKALCHSIRARGQVEPIHLSRDEAIEPVLASVLKPEDVLITQGAGAIGQIAQEILQHFSTQD